MMDILGPKTQTTDLAIRGSPTAKMQICNLMDAAQEHSCRLKLQLISNKNEGHGPKRVVSLRTTPLQLQGMVFRVAMM